MPDLLSAFNALAVSTDALLGDALAPYALFSQQGRTIGTIAIDVPIRETHNDSFAITQAPVQSGVTISDHYFRAPPKLEMTCGFSDSTAGYLGYVQSVYAAFQALADTRTPFGVSTGKRNYDSCLIESLDVQTDEYSEWALNITIRLQQIIITDTTAGAALGLGTAENMLFPWLAPAVNVGRVSLIPYTGDTSFIDRIKALTGG